MNELSAFFLFKTCYFVIFHDITTLISDDVTLRSFLELVTRLNAFIHRASPLNFNGLVTPLNIFLKIFT